MNVLDPHMRSAPDLDSQEMLTSPIQIFLLGNFRLMVAGEIIPLAAGGLGEKLLSYLGCHYGSRVPQERLLCLLWPAKDPKRARHSLNNLVYRLNKSIDTAYADERLVLYEAGY